MADFHFRHQELQEQSIEHPTLQAQTLVVPNDSIEGDIQQRIDLARQETKHLYAQIDKIKSKNQDAGLREMSKTVNTLTSKGINLKHTMTMKGHGNKIADFRWSQDSKSLLSASQDGFMLLWDCESGFKKNAITLDSQWVLTCAMSPSGNLVASGGLNNNCTIYRVNKEERVQQNIVSIFKGHTCYISHVEFFDNSRVLTASGDMTCAFWDIPKSKRVREFTDHLGDVLTLSLPPSGTANSANVFASAGSDGHMYLWDVRTPASTQDFFVSDSDVNTIKFFKDGNSIVTGSDDGVMRMFDLRADSKISEYSLSRNMRPDINSASNAYNASYTPRTPKSPATPASSSQSFLHMENLGVISLDFSLSGRLMYVCYADTGVLIWDTLKGEVVDKLEGHSNRVSKLQTSPDGLALCTGSWDSTLRIWSPNYM